MIRRALAILTVLASMPAAAEAPPARVVSVNLCTDQLALLIGAPGQVISVSSWAASERASMMVEAARALPLNDANAEEVYLMDPDLVLAGTFTRAASVGMMRRLGLRVELFPPVDTLEDLRAALARMGALLGREARAAEIAAAFDAVLAAEQARPGAAVPVTGAFYYQNNYTAGQGTLAHELMQAAGVGNLAAALGYRSVAKMPLEVLVMERPFLIRTVAISDADIGRSGETLAHPVMGAVESASGGTVVEDRWQVCGTPFVVETVRALVDAREGGGSGPGPAFTNETSPR